MNQTSLFSVPRTWQLKGGISSCKKAFICLLLFPGIQVSVYFVIVVILIAIAIVSVTVFAVLHALLYSKKYFLMAAPSNEPFQCHLIHSR